MTNSSSSVHARRQKADQRTTDDRAVIFIFPKGLLLFVGPSQGVKMIRKIVQDCIVHNVHPVRWSLGNNFQKGFSNEASGCFALMNCDS
ncbi:hypothetical protein M0R45_028117 [Rubus argutus]|uniref:Uncharacterized protein n=1 Tax=Rubus argutus TaxID=59490 RepID=A0AAW1W6Q7_RUBAR